MLTGMVGAWLRLDVLILPTRGNLVGLLLLAPALTVLAALAGLRVSARFTDVPGATQFTGLVVVPLTLVGSRSWTAGDGEQWIGLAGAVLVGLSAAGLCQQPAAVSPREILTKWR